ncbi:MAG: rhomboid family intramembrane serine protease [Ignavibacteriae bacterium]|nr:rhomboid family intramembrane serine protease [Ignavibacteriota bacterium]
MLISRWVLRLIIANVVVFVLTVYRSQFANFLAFVPLEFLHRPWTLATYMFVHDTTGISHILFNMLALFFFGPRLEMELGSKHFLGLYFTSGLIGALLHLVFNPLSPIVGASGAVYGVMLGYAMFWPRDRVYIWGVLPVEVRIMVLIMTALSLFGGFGAFSDGIAHFAHLGGFLGGFLYVKLLQKRSRIQQVQSKIVEPIVHAGNIQKWRSIPRGTLHEVNREEYDRIIAKLDRHGVASLTESEKAFLERFSH